MRNVIVTGGAGFIGSHLVSSLLSEGCRVVVLDDLSTGKIANLPNDPHCHLIEVDIVDELALARIFESERPNLIYHEAAIASVQKSIFEPERTSAVNDHGAKHVFELAVHVGAEQVVFASSAAVYGDDPRLPKSEKFEPTPISPYGAQKWQNEKDAFRLSKKGVTRFTGLRYFNVFGPRQDPKSEYSGVISIFVDKILHDKAITIYGDGEQTRDFVNVADIVLANLSVRKAPSFMNVYNVGTAQETSLLDLAGHLYTIEGRDKSICFELQREGDIRRSVADIGLIMSETSYLPKIHIIQGLSGLVSAVKLNYNE